VIKSEEIMRSEEVEEVLLGIQDRMLALCQQMDAFSDDSFDRAQSSLLAMQHINGKLEAILLRIHQQAEQIEKVCAIMAKGSL